MRFTHCEETRGGMRVGLADSLQAERRQCFRRRFGLTALGMLVAASALTARGPAQAANTGPSRFAAVHRWIATFHWTSDRTLTDSQVMSDFSGTDNFHTESQSTVHLTDDADPGVAFWKGNTRDGGANEGLYTEEAKGTILAGAGQPARQYSRSCLAQGHGIPRDAFFQVDPDTNSYGFITPTTDGFTGTCTTTIAGQSRTDTINGGATVFPSQFDVNNPDPAFHLQLPADGLVLAGSRSFVMGQSSGYPIHLTLTWEIKPDVVCAVTANAGGPYTAVRGQRITLDGSRSTGPIKSYKWTFRGVNGEINPNAGKVGSRASIVVLDSVEATLTVTDGASCIDTESVMVTVTPRTGNTWITPVKNHYPEKDLDGPPPGSPGYNAADTLCSIDGSREKHGERHLIHPRYTSVGANGYKPAVVRDPEGPYDTFYYVGSQQLQISLATFVNKYIREKSKLRMFSGSASSFYKQNVLLRQTATPPQTRPDDVAAYLAAIRKREQRFQEDVLQQIRQHPQTDDPATVIERMYSSSVVELESQANNSVLEINIRLRDTLDKPSVVDWEGVLAAGTAPGTTAPLFGLLRVGGPAYHHE